MSSLQLLHVDNSHVTRVNSTCTHVATLVARLNTNMPIPMSLIC